MLKKKPSGEHNLGKKKKGGKKKGGPAPGPHEKKRLRWEREAKEKKKVNYF